MNTPRTTVANSRQDQQLFFEIGLAAALLLVLGLLIGPKEFQVQASVRSHADPGFVVEQVPITFLEKVEVRPQRPVFEIVDTEDDLGTEEIPWPSGEDWVPTAPPPMPDFGAAAEVPRLESWEVEIEPAMVGGSASLYNRIRYPKMAQEAGVPGRAQIGFVVGVDGLARDFEILGERPEGFGFATAAIEALRQVRFEPGQQWDRKVAVHMSQLVTFEVR